MDFDERRKPTKKEVLDTLDSELDYLLSISALEGQGENSVEKSKKSINVKGDEENAGESESTTDCR